MEKMYGEVVFIYLFVYSVWSGAKRERKRNVDMGFLNFILLE